MTKNSLFIFEVILETICIIFGKNIMNSLENSLSE